MTVDSRQKERERNEEGRGRYGEERKGSARRMKHLGDITKLNGAEIPFVDIITGGSPCQDLSIAGKRKGLAGERSGLFMDQMRLIKEQRNETKRLFDKGAIDSVRPRFMVWENVPGAFSSNKGEDFRCVLEETAKVADENATIPRLDTGKDGKQKWSKSGAIMGDGWSIAWRVHDAQFWGVPQRRKRISLVADFGGTTAPEILFERKSLPRDIETSREEKQGITTDAERSTRETSKCLNSWDVQSKHIQPEEGIAEALYSGECRGGGGESYVLQKTSACGGTNTSGAKVCYRKTSHAKSKEDGQGWQETEVNDTLNIFDNGESRTPTIVLENHPNDSRVKIREDGKVQTLSSRMGTGGGNVPMVMEEPYNATTSKEIAKSITSAATDANHIPCAYNNTSVVRRLTPLECERLQGYPDGWTDIGEWVDSKGKKRKDSDSPRYKALGNSIALPFWQWMANKMVKYIDGHQPTMASLFDGIGGFPLVFSRAGAKPIWASEIEEFPIAVTKIRFPDMEEEE
jgi:DNA (cytosine-5)-methyltransferase 1